MRIAMIGTGYVGLVSGACFSDFGFHVTCIDNDAKKIAAIEAGDMPIYEPGLEELVAKNCMAGRLAFTQDIRRGVADADVVFIAVGTPSRRGDGHADMTFVFQAAEEIGAALVKPAVIVTKSTVPVGTGRKVAEIIRTVNPKAKFEIASNPEFLREGSAIEDFKRPDRVVAGVESERAKEIISTLYRPLFLNETPILFTGIETAELIKYASNAFLATKIAFINEMADLCEKLGANVQEVARGLGLDKRIGAKFLHPGPGYGGSCFPKDTMALIRIAQEAGAPTRIVETVAASNEARKKRMAEKIIAVCGGVKGKTLAVLGLTFKPNTDDMRDSASLVIVPALIQAGARIRTHDPKGMEEAKKLLKQDAITWCKDAYDALDGSDAAVILTEWNEFRSLDLTELKKRMRMPQLIDLRNIYKRQEMEQAGISYTSIGR